MKSTKIIHLALAVMQRRFPRICPLCEKPGVINLSSHLEIVHGITWLIRTQLLKETRVYWESKKEYIPTSVLPRCSSTSPRETTEPEKEHDQ